MRFMMRPYMLLVACVALVGCWESEQKIYDSSDFYHRKSGELITISDRYGPLGLHFAGAGNRYLPVYTKAKQGTPEFLFRRFRIGMIPIDRALATNRSADWIAEREHSRTILKDGNAHLFILVLEADEVEGQGFAFGYAEGNKLSICPEVLQKGSVFHDRFKTFVLADGAPENKKRGVANLIWYSSGVAKRQGKLDCSHYTVASRSEEDFEEILQAIDRGDALRARGGREFPSPKAQSRKRLDPSEKRECAYTDTVCRFLRESAKGLAEMAERQN
ncbi:MAG: hypothetical protein V2I43_21715 [Parvularcula sp.]|jgi:hypothetical protein|nr:hypothetical protein [Parvularcula sp.]